MEATHVDRYQKEAIEHSAKYLQIIAGPGTGKTTVLASRIVWLLRQGIDPSTIYAIAYTNRARNILINRVNELLGPNSIQLAQEMHVSTYHSLCAKLIELHPEVAGVTPEWSLIDEFDRQEVLNVPEIGAPRKNRSKFPDEMPKFVVDKYHRWMRQRRCYDYEEQVRLATKIAQAGKLDNAHHLLIDEFQDGEQELWSLVLALTTQNPKLHVTVVGDPNQEIFAFRSKHLRNSFKVMQQTLPKKDLAVVRLQTNYRSTKCIVDTINGIVAPEYRLQTPETTEPGPDPDLSLCVSPETEQQHVVNAVDKLLQQGNRPRDIAILVRSNQNVLDFSQALRNRGISVGDNFDRAILRNNLVFTILKLCAHRNDVLLQNLATNSWRPLIDRRTLLKARANSNDEVADKVLSHRRTKQFITEVLPPLTELANTSNSMHQVAGAITSTLLEWKNFANVASNIQKWSSPSFEELVVPTSEVLREHKIPPRYIELLQITQRLAAEPSLIDPREPAAPQVTALLQEPSLIAHANTEGVNVQTIHAAKGHEWPIVFLPQGRGFDFGRTNQMSDDERKLLYVAASRAQTQLTFTNASLDIGFSRNKYLRGMDASLPAAITHKYPKVYAPVFTKLLRSIPRFA